VRSEPPGKCPHRPGNAPALALRAETTVARFLDISPVSPSTEQNTC
jgi:hypothetical protein